MTDQEPDVPDLAEAHAILERTPHVLRAWLAGLPEAWADARTEGPDSFSPRDVLGHLVGGERTDWMARARLILEHGESRRFEPFDRFAFRGEPEGPLSRLLEEFAGLRERNLAELSGLRLEPADLARRGTHPDLGAVTLGQLLATWVAHDLGHLAQIARVMAKRYGAAVGPWKAYLPVLTR